MTSSGRGVRAPLRSYVHDNIAFHLSNGKRLLIYLKTLTMFAFFVERKIMHCIHIYTIYTPWMNSPWFIQPFSILVLSWHIFRYSQVVKTADLLSNNRTMSRANRELSTMTPWSKVRILLPKFIPPWFFLGRKMALRPTALPGWCFSGSMPALGSIGGSIPPMGLLINR